MYPTCVEEQLDKGNNVILEIEIQGAMNIKRMFPDAVLMFITPPSAAELENRLRGRGTEDEATIKARLSRAAEEADALERKDKEAFLNLVKESGRSSWELLQNCYTMKDFHEQKITRTLALTQLFLKKIGAGVCRVHGGGFAGVIAAIVPEKEQDNYVEYISRFVGKENVYPMDIRAIGAVHIG